MTAPPAGVLEELDGGPIRPQRASRPAPPWPGAMAAASVVVASRPRLWVFSLLAFLARGGLVVLIVPMLALPTFVGLSNTVGPTSVTAAGPTPHLIVLVATWLGTALVAMIGGTLVAAAAEVALYRATVAPPAGGRGGAVRPGVPLVGAAAPRGSVRHVATVRLALLVPVAVAVAVAVPAWVQVGYSELLLPSDLAVPFPIRVLAGAPIQAAVVVGAWLAAEVVGGLVARRVALDGTSIGRAFAAAAGDLARAPGTGLVTLVVAIAGSLLVLVPAVAAVGAAWNQARVALIDGTNAVAIVLASLVLVAAWAGCLVVAGIGAAWRSVLVTAEVARHSQEG